MSKTAAKILADIAHKGFSVGQGRRYMTAAKQLYAIGKVRAVTVNGFNANGDRSQWNNPRFVAARETFVV